jgi:hypothetical protein
MTEFEKSSRRAISLVNAIRRSPAARLRFSLAELERYPIGLMISGALVFDHHTHLRHDMVSALGPAGASHRLRPDAGCADLDDGGAEQSSRPRAGRRPRRPHRPDSHRTRRWNVVDRRGRRPHPVRRQGGRAHHRPCADVCLNVRDVGPVVTRLVTQQSGEASLGFRMIAAVPAGSSVFG